MRPPVLAALLVLAGCIVYERRPYAEPPPAPAQAHPVISRDQAVEVAFRLCADRQLRVDRVEQASLDPAGRWHVLLAGYLDRAQLLLDGRDGKLLKGRFRQVAPAPAAAPAPPGPSGQPPPAEPPPPADDFD
jgi:hypothetical protein